MAKSAAERAEISRQSGRKSQGPHSAAGKDRSKFNQPFDTMHGRNEIVFGYPKKFFHSPEKGLGENRKMGYKGIRDRNVEFAKNAPCGSQARCA
jgi:hypothetical protein